MLKIVAIGLLVFACLFAGGFGGRLMVHHGRRIFGYVLGWAGVAVGAALTVFGSMSPGMEGVAYGVPGALLVIPLGLGVLIGTRFTSKL